MMHLIELGRPFQAGTHAVREPHTAKRDCCRRAPTLQRLHTSRIFGTHRPAIQARGQSHASCCKHLVLHTAVLAHPHLHLTALDTLDQASTHVNQAHCAQCGSCSNCSSQHNLLHSSALVTSWGPKELRAPLKPKKTSQ